jgi:hypothetical protein
VITGNNFRNDRGSRFGLLLFAALLAILLAPGRLFAQASLPATNAAVEPPSTNRFLFVLDTSAVMRPHIADMVDVVEGIIRSSASGQLHNGDTIGVWTFNEDLYTGAMPLQTWSSDDTEEIALRIAEFIRQQDYVKKSRLDLATSAINKVVKMSDILTVFIVSSGNSPISGTPFDDDLNAQYRQCLHDMGKKPRPVVTVLQASRGKLIRYTVNAMPWPVVIPELPIPLNIASGPSTASPSTPAAALVATNPPIATPSVPAVSTSAPTVPTTPTAYNPLSRPNPVPSTPFSANQAQPQLPTVPPGNTPTNIPPPQFSQPAAVPQPQTVSTPPAVEPTPTTPTPAPVISTPAPPVVASTPPSTTPAPAPTANTPTRPMTETSTIQAVHPMPETPAPAAQGPISSELPVVQPHPTPLVPRPQPATEVLAADSAALSTAEAQPASPKTLPTPTSLPAPKPAVAQPAPAPAPPQKTLIAQATALFKSYTGGHTLLFIGGGAIIVVALGLILLTRRSHSSGRVSLITQTMDDRRR